LVLVFWPTELPAGEGSLALYGDTQHMAEIFNLRNARKRAERRLSEKRAAAARVSHGMSKADRTLAQANRDKMCRELDEHRIETGEADEIAGR
jgi:hypothetical protein